MDARKTSTAGTTAASVSNPFHDLEAPIDDAANAALVLSSLFEDVKGEKYGEEKRFVIHAHEHRLLAFMIYDLVRRTSDVRQAFYATHDAEAGK